MNSELDQLATALSAALDRLEPAGRCVALSYHSGEDRIVKNVFRREAGQSPPELPGLPLLADPASRVRLITRRPRRPTDAERRANRRASPARMRVVERLREGE